MAERQRGDSKEGTITANDVLESLLLQRITIYLKTMASESENNVVRGFLRGYSDSWIVLQEVGDKAQKADKLTLVNISSIQALKKTAPYD